MRRIVPPAFAAWLGLVSATSGVAEEGVLGYVNTAWHLTGSDYIDVAYFDDPGLPGVTCSLSRARTGGVTGTLGIATDSSKASVSCVQIDSIKRDDLARLPKQEQVFRVHTSILFKTTQVVRFVRPDHRLITYLVYSDHLIDGSPENATTSIGIRPE